MKLFMIAGVILALAVHAPAQQDIPPLPSGSVPPLSDLENLEDLEAKAAPVPAAKPVRAGAGVAKSTAPAVAAAKTSASVIKSTAPTATVPVKTPQSKPAALPALSATTAPIVIKPSGALPPDVKAPAAPAAPKPEAAKSAAPDVKKAAAAAKPEPKPEAVKPAAAAVSAAPAVPAPRKEAVKPVVAPAAPAAVKATEVKKETAKPAAPAAADGGFLVAKKHSVVKGETLWGLSGKYYGDPFKWGKIYNANMASIEDPDRIYPAEEIVIPEITETVKPAAKPEIVADMEVPAEETAVEEASASAIEAVVPAPVIPEPPAAKAKAADYDLAHLSDEMPEDQREWPPGARVVVPENWKADGVLLSRAGSSDSWETLTTPGDKVRVKVRNPASFRPGQVLTSYKKGAHARDRKTNKKLGLELQKTGSLEVLSISKNIVIGRIIEANTSIDEGQVIKR